MRAGSASQREPQRRPWRSSIGAVALVSALAATGCTGNLNTADDLYDADPVVSFHTVVGPPEELARADDAPSLAGLDRGNWPVTPVVSPPAQVEFNPPYVDDVLVDTTTPRGRGEYPTLETMLDGPGSNEQQALQAIAEIPYSAFLLVVSPIRMVQTPPWAVMRGPGGYERLPDVTERDLSRWYTKP